MAERTAAPPRFGARWRIVASILVACALACWYLELRPAELLHLIRSGTLGDFLGAAISPAVAYEDPAIPDDVPPLLRVALQATWNTVLYALAATGLAVALGAVFGVLGSTSWWPMGTSGKSRSTLVAILAVTRAAAAFVRSIHELLWALLFLAVFGLHELSAVLAVAIPFSGAIAKLVSELLEEAPRGVAAALRAGGASSLQVVCFGLLPRALPDLLGYAFYRFECALRSTAVLGFFGLQTLGFHIRTSFDQGYYRQGWTYLYALFAVILVVDQWSGAIRRRLAR